MSGRCSARKPAQGGGEAPSRPPPDRLGCPVFTFTSSQPEGNDSRPTQPLLLTLSLTGISDPNPFIHLRVHSFTHRFPTTACPQALRIDTLYRPLLLTHTTSHREFTARRETVTSTSSSKIVSLQFRVTVSHESPDYWNLHRTVNPRLPLRLASKLNQDLRNILCNHLYQVFVSSTPNGQRLA